MSFQSVKVTFDRKGPQVSDWLFCLWYCYRNKCSSLMQIIKACCSKYYLPSFHLKFASPVLNWYMPCWIRAVISPLLFILLPFILLIILFLLKLSVIFHHSSYLLLNGWFSISSSVVISSGLHIPIKMIDKWNPDNHVKSFSTLPFLYQIQGMAIPISIQWILRYSVVLYYRLYSLIPAIPLMAWNY